jgi:hypothetical protein
LISSPEAARIQQVMLDTGVLVSFSVLITEHLWQQRRSRTERAAKPSKPRLP